MSFIDWALDRFAASNDVLDLYFIISDLVDIPQSEEELCETAYHNALCSYQENNHRNSGGSNPYTGDDTPIGKTVI